MILNTNIYGSGGSSGGIAIDDIAMRTISGVASGSATYISTHAFFGCGSLTEALFPACISIGASAFQNCSNLTKASFPVCTSIGSYAFFNCSKLTEVSFPACISILTYAFSFCSSVQPFCSKNMASARF